MNDNQQFSEDARRIASAFSEIPRDRIVKGISHLDCDGICAASLLIWVLGKRGIKYSASTVHYLNNEQIESLKNEEYEYFVFLDVGATQISSLQRMNATVFVIDHHPPENGVDAVVTDVREEFGATTTILVEYLRELGITPETDTATAMLFAIRAETLEYLRGATPMEYEASQYLHELADIDLLERMTQPAFTPETLDTIGEAILGREVRASSLVAGVGVITERDALPQAADYLMRLEGISTVLVFGVVDDRIEISARSKDSRVDLDSVMRDAFGDVGSGGGHREMAGAQVPLGVFSDMAEADDKMIELVSGTVKKRFFGSMNLQEEEDED